MKHMSVPSGRLFEILGIDLPTRARRAMIEANVGFGVDQARRIESALGPGFCQPLQCERIPRQSAHEVLTDGAAEAAWRAAAQAWLDSRSEAHRCGWTMALEVSETWFEDRGSLRIPCLPWDKDAATRAVPDVSGLMATGAGSMRGIDLYNSGDDAPLLNVKRSLPNTSVPGAGLSRERLKRRVLRWLFGLEDRVDTSLLTRIDALQGIWITGRLRAGREALPPWLDVLEETEAAGDAAGQAVILRRYPQRAGLIALPCFALAHGRSARRNLLPDLARLGGLDPVIWALKVGRMYLGAWWALVRELGLVMIMPHAQNAYVLLDASGAPRRLMIKDLRDIDHVSSYAALSQHSIRLQGVCRAYLAYEMRVHPVYFDVAPWRRAPLEEAIFNFSFQMLRNHVLRGLEASLPTPEDAARYRSGITATIAALAAGADPADLDVERARTVASLAAIRALRHRFVQEFARLA